MPSMPTQGVEPGPCPRLSSWLLPTDPPKALPFPVLLGPHPQLHVAKGLWASASKQGAARLLSCLFLTSLPSHPGDQSTFLLPHIQCTLDPHIQQDSRTSLARPGP